MIKAAAVFVALPLAAGSACTVNNTNNNYGSQPSGGPAPATVAPSRPAPTPRQLDTRTLHRVIDRTSTMRALYGQLLNAMDLGSATAPALAARFAAESGHLAVVAFQEPRLENARAAFASSLAALSVDLEQLAKGAARSPTSAATESSATLTRGALRAEAANEIALARAVGAEFPAVGFAGAERRLDPVSS